MAEALNEVLHTDVALFTLSPTPGEDGFDTRPRHEPPTPAFMQALETPQYFTVDGADYAAYTFNPNEPGLPVATFLPLEKGTASRRSVSKLSVLATCLHRPIVSIDMLGTGRSDPPSIGRLLFKTSLDSVAHASNQVLDQMGIEEVVFAGFCVGATIATQAAVQRGERARHLLTFALTGFEKDSLIRLSEQAARTTPEARIDKESNERANREAVMYDDQDLSFLDISELPGIAVHNIKRQITLGWLALEHNYARPLINKRTLVRRMLPALIEMLGSPEAAQFIGTVLEDQPKSLLEKRALMQTLPHALHPSTRWHDHVGEVDILSDWRHHVIATKQRNAQHPGSSHLTVVQGASHRWPMIRIPYAAQMAKAALVSSEPSGV